MKKLSKRDFLKTSAIASGLIFVPKSFARQVGVMDTPIVRAPSAGGIVFPSSGLVSYWKFDESSGNAADQIGGNTLTNNNSTAYTSGKINNAATFVSASSQSLSCTGTNTRLTTALSLNCWVNVVSLPTFAQTAEFVDNFQFNASGYQFGIFNNTVNSNFAFSLYKSSNTPVTITDPSVTPTATWVMVTATWDGTTMTLYRNASSIASTSLSAPLGAYSPPSFSVGSGYTNMFYNGLLDELGLWNRALTSTEITTIYNSGIGLTYP